MNNEQRPIGAAVFVIPLVRLYTNNISWKSGEQCPIDATSTLLAARLQPEQLKHFGWSNPTALELEFRFEQTGEIR